MTNEPVAWLDKRTNKCVVFINTPPSDDWIPLYTHPADLIDEEIVELTPWKKFPYESFVEYTIDDVVDFARAILRKAQEK